MQKSQFKKLEALPDEAIDQLVAIADFLKLKEQDRNPQDLIVSVDVLGDILDQVESDLQPIIVRAKTIVKQMNSGHFNNRKIAQLAASILEAVNKANAKIAKVHEISTRDRIGARRCTCDIVDLWNGKGCTCGGI